EHHPLGGVLGFRIRAMGVHKRKMSVYWGVFASPDHDKMLQELAEFWGVSRSEAIRRSVFFAHLIFVRKEAERVEMEKVS
ncbi:MAG: hypothetical protein ABDI20_09475, partial [Candidatus Bipolaricaulaceae bacterium]